ncbi:CAP domain-containing protein [Streptomyces sp. NRRL S-241]|uniref:CAP domain-containing protein n=1 Tax=Streptomyces sp. NRRL S-241 TaxID=1463896 RepID=UPI00131CE0E0|nr:CAP domain-containing protein [Streptomyces sp. NRRL S-241]
MRDHDDEFSTDRPRRVRGRGRDLGRGRGAHGAAGRGARRATGHRRSGRRAPVLAAAAVVLLAGVGAAAYALGSDRTAPHRTAAEGTPSVLGGRPSPAGTGTDLIPATTTASPTAGTSTSAAGATPGTGAAASASPAKDDGRRAAGAPAERSTGPTGPTAPSTRPAGSGPTGPDPKVPGARTTTQDVSEAQALSLHLLNAERAAAGRRPLALKQDLSDFARKWAEHMKKSGFSHSSSDDRAYLKTGSRTWTGENIVWYSDASMTAQEAAEKFQSMWRHSPGHYKAQVNPDFTEVGVGLYHDASGWWGVHNFSDGK